MINGTDAVLVAIDEVKGYMYPSDAERAAAYELLVELSTRTSSAHLASTDDSIRDAMADLQQLFGLTRRILRAHGTDASKGSAGNISLAVVAVRVLNEVIRPVLSRWQPLLSDYEARRPIDVSAVEWEQQWDRGPRCRSELRAMRSSIRAYVDTLGQIAGAPEISDAILRVPTSTMAIKRPMTATPDLTIKPREEMVRWFDLREMVEMGVSTLRAKASLKEIEGRPPSWSPDLEPTLSISAAPDEEFWFDYVADMGDGFDGTAPVAWLVGRDELEVPDDHFSEFPTPPTSMPHADLLVFGGDEVYTYAAEGRYASHTELPYQMGLEGGTDKQPPLVAIPGNHDWMGGLEHFEEMFVSKRPFAGHWPTVQDHPWWHVRLPQGWWLWGIDTALDNKLVRDQDKYFERAAEDLRAGDRVILCSPVPLWQLRQKFRDDYATLRNTIDPLILGRGATMPLCLSGDSHFFAHYERLDTDFGEDHVTAGGGGAFLQPTHNLAERIPLEEGNAEFKLTSRWPRPADSRALAASVSTFFSPQFWPLMLLMGLLHLAYAGLVAAWHPTSETDGWESTARTTASAPLGLLFLALLAVAMIPAVKGNSHESKLTSGARSYALLTGVAVGATLVITEILRRQFFPGDWYGYLLAAVFGGAITIVVFFTMMKWTNSRIKASDTVAFSPAASTRFKHFLRFRIDRHGDLTCFAIGIDPVGEKWYENMVSGQPVPPHDPDGIPQLHYVWGKTFRKFEPIPIRISVSISDLEHPSGTSPDDAFEQVCAALIDGGHTLMYGGIPDAGYTARLRDIEVARHADNPNADHHLINYVPDYLWGVWEEVESERRDKSAMRTIRVKRGGTEPGAAREVRDLSLMRRHMTDRSDLRIVIGGALQPGAPNARLAPGIIEEAYVAVEADIPLIVAGGFGGAAGLIADVLLGRADPADIDQIALHFRLPEPTPNGSSAPSFREMLARFRSTGVLRNGLTDGENEELLRSSDPNTVSELILRSVHRIGSHHAG